MSLGRTTKIEGGHARGHSRMCHWEHTEDIKRKTKKLRRKQDKKMEQYGRSQ